MSSTRRGSTAVVRGAALAVAIVTSTAWAGAPLLQAQSAPRVSLPQSAGPPGGKVAVPIQVTIPDGVEIGQMTLTVRTPAASLAFGSVSLGGLAVGVDMKAEASTKTDGQDLVLTVVLSTPEEGGKRIPMPAGPIGDLLFTVAKDAVVETGIPLALTVKATSAAGGAAVDMQAKDGQVVVSNPSVVTCFFYMH